MYLQIFYHLGKSSSTCDNDTKPASILMIVVPTKIWRPKQENKYRVPYYIDDIDGRIC